LALTIQKTRTKPTNSMTVDPCSAVAPFMRAMECIPEGDDDDENENPLLSSIRSLNRGGSIRSSSSSSSSKLDPSTRLQNLKTRLETFWSKGWLSRKEYQQHLDFLSTFDVACIGANGKYAMRELEKEFDKMEDEKNSEPAPQSWSDMFMSTLGVSTAKTTKTSSAAGISSFWSNSMAASTNAEDEDEENENETSNKKPLVKTNKQPLATATNRTVNGTRAPTIVAPRDLSNIMSSDDVSEIFVQTCFFARLGFVQPPCCMSCTYKEALKGSMPDMDCREWVVWRRDASKTFDPSNNANIGDNAMAVQCRTARKLAAGKTVESYEWDAHLKLLRKKQ